MKFSNNRIVTQRLEIDNLFLEAKSDLEPCRNIILKKPNSGPKSLNIILIEEELKLKQPNKGSDLALGVQFRVLEFLLVNTNIMIFLDFAVNRPQLFFIFPRS